nr:hypothetical protein [uncultured bacterium]
MAIAFQIKKPINILPKNRQKCSVLLLFINHSIGINPTKSKGAKPLTGQERPRRSPERIVSNNLFGM